jgi:hypothetical protein
VNQTVLLVTPHGFAEVILTLNPDNSLSYSSHRGGFIRWDLTGARSTPLPKELRNSALGVANG